MVVIFVVEVSLVKIVVLVVEVTLVNVVVFVVEALVGNVVVFVVDVLIFKVVVLILVAKKIVSYRVTDTNLYFTVVKRVFKLCRTVRTIRENRNHPKYLSKRDELYGPPCRPRKSLNKYHY